MTRNDESNAGSLRTCYRMARNEGAGPVFAAVLTLVYVPVAYAIVRGFTESEVVENE